MRTLFQIALLYVLLLSSTKLAAQEQAAQPTDTNWKKYTLDQAKIALKERNFEAVDTILQFAFNKQVDTATIALICFSAKQIALKKKPRNDGTLSLALKYAQQSLDLNTAIKQNKYAISDTKEIGKIYHQLGNYKQAIKTYHKAKQLVPLSDSTQLADNYYKIFKIYYQLGDYKNAEYNLHKVIELYPYQDDLLAEVYSHLGNNYRAQKQYNPAIAALKKAIKIATKKENTSNHFTDLGSTYMLADSSKKALLYFQKAEVIYTALKDTQQLETLYNNMAINYKRAYQYDQALNYLKKALVLNEATTQNDQVAKAGIYDNWGDVLYAQHQYKPAATYYHKAIQEVIPTYKDAELNTLPNLTDKTSSNTVLLTFIASKAKALLKAASPHKEAPQLKTNTENWTLALKHFQLVDTLINDMRLAISEEESKLLWLEDTKSIYEKAIESAYHLYQKDKAPKYLEQAFTFMEKSKSVLLLEAVRDLQAKSTALIPNEQLEKERQLKRQISQAPTNELLQAKTDYNNFIQQLEKDYPEYYALKYQSDIPTIKTIQANTLQQDNQAAIEYFVGEEHIYLLKITKSQTHLTRVEKADNFEQIVLDFTIGCAQANTPLTQLLSNGRDLYRILYQPLLSDGIDLPKHLIIIPDDILNNIPFQALPLSINTPTAPINPKDATFLISKHTLTRKYALSLKEQQKKIHTDKSIGIAPVEFDYGDYPALLASQKEVEHIGFDNIWTKQAANKNAFIKQAGQFNIIHLSTHADQNGIYFHDAILSSEELYLLQLDNTQMISLSACETALGALKKGEGVMSISRALAYAGSPSTVATLWSVNEQATTAIATQFYQYLNEGLPKDQALHQAKLQYIQKVKKAKAHPYYWAAPIHIGNTIPIIKAYAFLDSLWFKALTGVLGFLLLLFVGKRFWKAN